MRAEKIIRAQKLNHGEKQSEIRYLTPINIEIKKESTADFKSQALHIDFKDPDFLLKFVNEQGKILPRRVTGTSLKFQRKVIRLSKERDT